MWCGFHVSNAVYAVRQTNVDTEDEGVIRKNIMTLKVLHSGSSLPPAVSVYVATVL